MQRVLKMRVIEERVEMIQEKSSNFTDFLIPAVAICLGSIIMALIQIFSVVLLLLAEPIILVDEPITSLLIVLLSQMIGAPIVYYGLISFFKVKESEYRPITMNSFGKTFLLFCVSFSVYGISSLIFTNICLAFDLIPQSGFSNIFLTAEHLQNPLKIFLFLFPTTIGAAVFEELLYRRMLIPLLEQRGMSPFSAVFASSLVFALGHLITDLVGGNLAGGIIHVWTVFLLALALGMTYVLTRNVFFPILIHATSNFISFLAPLLILMEADILLQIRSFTVITLIITGGIIGINAIFKYLSDSRTEWLKIIKMKSEYNITRGLVGFMIIAYLLISIPVMLELSSLYLRVIGILDFFVSIGLLITIYVLLLVMFLYFGYKRRNDITVGLFEEDKPEVKLYNVNKHLNE